MVRAIHQCPPSLSVNRRRIRGRERGRVVCAAQKGEESALDKAKRFGFAFVVSDALVTGSTFLACFSCVKALHIDLREKGIDVEKVLKPVLDMAENAGFNGEDTAQFLFEFVSADLIHSLLGPAWVAATVALTPAVAARMNIEQTPEPESDTPLSSAEEKNN